MEKLYVWILTCIIIIIFFKIYSKLTNRNIIKTHPRLHPPNYEIFYTDQKVSQKEEGVIYSKLLISEKNGLQGKPDFIFINKNGSKLLPVELKSGLIGENLLPHKGDLMQLVAYFIIIEDIYEVRPKSGRLIYKDYMFLVKNTAGLRKQVNSIVDDMRDMLETGEGESSPSFVKCKHCICRGTVCEYCD